MSSPNPADLPKLGLGTWRMGESRAAHAAELAALRAALDIGYRAFDTAEMYGDGGAETLLGQALATALRGPLRRDELCVISKVYPHHASAPGVAAACERSLKRLQLDRLDLYLLHWRGSTPLAQTIEGFERLRQRGLIRRWGVSNFDLDDLQELTTLPQGAHCAANQVWYSLSRRGVEYDLLPWQQARQLPLMAYSPIDQGALARHAGLKRLAASVGATPSQLALARLLAEPGVMVIPKSTDPARLRENFEAASLTLDATVRAQIDALFPPPQRKQALAVG
ncbi:MAG TPA: aldo/keto reductase [Rubrivivax sp.]|nr:aldo/keto reductase [Rubrivivax sp.]